jgi:hypothetical protein
LRSRRALATSALSLIALAAAAAPVNAASGPTIRTTTEADRPAEGVCWSAPIGYHICPLIVLKPVGFRDRFSALMDDDFPSG